MTNKQFIVIELGRLDSSGETPRMLIYAENIGEAEKNYRDIVPGASDTLFITDSGAMIKYITGGIKTVKYIFDLTE